MRTTAINTNKIFCFALCMTLSLDLPGFTRELVTTNACVRQVPAPIEGQVCRHYPNTFQVFSSSHLFLFRYDLPANSTDAGFQTQSTDNLLEKKVLPARACQNGVHFNFVRMFNVVAL